MKRFQRGLTIAALLLAACGGTDKPAPQGDADPAIAALNDSISKDTSNWQLQANLANTLRHKNRVDEAMAAAQKAFMLAPAPAVEAQLVMAKVHAAAERPASAINIVKSIEKKRAAAEINVDEVEIAEVYGVLGDTEAVFRWLARAETAHSPNLTGLAGNADLASVHADARWPHYAETYK
ncbi:MAG TPA: hypothetical protein VF021_01145 [Longimicrobiales bacterium]